MTTLRPAWLSTSALTPPPAPVPIIMTSASIVLFAVSVAASFKSQFSLWARCLKISGMAIIIFIYSEKLKGFFGY